MVYKIGLNLGVEGFLLCLKF